MKNERNLSLEETKISLTAILFSLYLLVFPIDSALGNIVGTISINNYVAIAFFISCVLFMLNRIEIYPNSMIAVYWVFVLFQLFSIIHGQDVFSNRNVIFVFYSLLTLLLCHIDWNLFELKWFKYSIVSGIVVAMVVIVLNIDLDSSGRLYLAVGRNIDQNYLTANFIFGTALIGNSIFHFKQKGIKVILLCLLVIEFGCILFLGSRGGFLGNIAVLLMVVFSNKTKLNWKTILWLFVFLFFVLMFFFFSPYVPSWITSRFDFSNMIQDGGAGRLEIWGNYLNTYIDAPLFNIFFGYGRGCIYQFPNINKCTHSIFIKALIEGGLLGFGLMIILLMTLFLRILKSGNRVLLSILVGYCVCGLFLDLDDYRIFPLMILLIVIFEKQDYFLGERESI